MIEGRVVQQLGSALVAVCGSLESITDTKSGCMEATVVIFARNGGQTKVRLVLNVLSDTWSASVGDRKPSPVTENTDPLHAMMHALRMAKRLSVLGEATP